MLLFLVQWPEVGTSTAISVSRSHSEEYARDRVMKVQKWLKYCDRKYANKLLRNEALGNRAKYTTCAQEYRQKHQLLRSQWFLKMRDNVRSRLQQAARCTAVARESIRRARRTLTMKLTADCEYWQKVDAAGSKFNQSLTEGLCHACVTIYKHSVWKFDMKQYNKSSKRLIDIATGSKLPNHFDKDKMIRA